MYLFNVLFVKNLYLHMIYMFTIFCMYDYCIYIYTHHVTFYWDTIKSSSPFTAHSSELLTYMYYIFNYYYTMFCYSAEINGQSNISLILAYRPPNTDCSLFLMIWKEIFQFIFREQAHIYIRDFNLDAFKSTPFKPNKVDAKIFTNILTGFNLFKLIHKSPSATLLDNIYTNYPITVETCKSGILTSDISDHFFVCGIFDNLNPKCSQRYCTQKLIVFLDLSKAFDTSNHKMLLSKLKNYGIIDISYNLLSTYLSNRKQ